MMSAFAKLLAAFGIAAMSAIGGPPAIDPEDVDEPDEIERREGL